ncbi:hypothetical protein Trydic_g21726 [Trypoxylus dichotomus]
MYPKLGSKKVNYCRIGISGFCLVSSVVMLASAGISLAAFDGDDMTKWSSQHGGYKVHVLSAITEWIMVILTMAYILTFSYEFRRITIYEPEIEYMHEDIKLERDTSNSLWLGLLAVFGVSLVANFQERIAWKLHFLGAALAYILGTIYTTFQTTLSILVYPKIGSKFIIGIRIAITFVYGVSLIKCTAFGIISVKMLNSTNKAKWSPKNQGYTYHLVSAVTEWILTILALLFFLTYVYEFKSVTIYEPILEISEDAVR